jgi:hypothetical protein
MFVLNMEEEREFILTRVDCDIELSYAAVVN